MCWLRFCRRIALLAVVVWMAGGCGDGRPPLAQVQGKVLFNGEPLEFGSVMFQPESGLPATGVIQPDGSFSLFTYEFGDGAQIGRHKVRVTCYEGQKPTKSGEGGDAYALGRALIPQRYASFNESGLEVVVEDDNEPVVIELTE